MEALIITSDASVKEQLEKGLRRRGYALTRCSHPEDAATAYRPERHALVIADVQPCTEGTERLRRLRKLVDAQQSLLLAVVPPGHSDTHRTVLDAGADDALVWLDEDTLDLRLALAEQRLKANRVRSNHEQRQAEILESITDGFLAVDRQWRLTYVNQQAEQILQRRRDELIGQNLWDVFPEAAGSAFYEQYHRAMREDVPVSFEAFYPPVDAWFSVHAYPFEGGLSLYLRDVTEQKQAEEREKWLGRILEDSKNEIYVFDAEDLRFIQVNRGARENLGYSMEELRQMTPLDLKPEFTRDAFEQLIAPLRTGEKERILFTTVHRRKDRSLYPVEVSLQLSTYESSSVFVAIILDVTAHREAEEALRESEARARAILETTVDAIITIDEQGIIETFNQAAERIFGYTAEEAVGQNIKMLMPSPYREEHDQYIQNYLSTGEKKIIGIGREVTGRRKDGTVFPLDLAVSEVQLGNRRIFTGIIRDISERKRLEREVLEATAEEQQRIGQELHDGLGSHLTGVAMSCRALARRLEKGRALQREDVEEIAELVQEGAQQARLLSRGLNPVKLTDKGLESALAELAANLQKLSGIPCLFRGKGDIPQQDAETTLHLYRIAQEAVNNALKHARAEHIWIRLAYKPHSITLTVRDDGVGLPKSLGEAEGIGHRVMQYRAHMIGATFHLRDAPGGGTLATCILPLDQTDKPAAVAVSQGTP